MSEQPSILSERQPMAMASNVVRGHHRMGSQPTATRRPQPQPVNLLMGYAHLAATFTVDGSLVDQSPFEDVKRKGFLGGQAGGGVVGVAQKKPRPNSGFLGAFNFNSIGESLNSLVGGDNMSSVKEMNAVTNSRAIPLLSTPQSLLFVNLHLEPGEERSYSFSCPLPRGLPSSYRGKAIKITYNVQVGVQTAPSGVRDQDHKVRQISVPVRVFSGVDQDGEILGHDLMQPHVILRDPARTKSIDDAVDSSDNTPSVTPNKKSKLNSADSFLTFIDTLLDRSRRRHSSAGSVLDAALPLSEHRTHATMAAIDRAIVLSNRLGPVAESTSNNQFNITRMGQPVAVVTLSRALFRLGETITAVVAFAAPETTSARVATLHATLETSEKVAQSLAVRSAASIARVTRRVYSSWSGNTLFSRRAVFSPTVPASGVPTFITSGVELAWAIKLEFSVVKDTTAPPIDDERQDPMGESAPAEDASLQEVDDSKVARTPTQLFEEVVKDERGVISIAVERLECESFEVVIPVTVYGDVVPNSGDKEDVRGLPI
jgi:RAB6A-GEF complex partner protein 2